MMYQIASHNVGKQVSGGAALGDAPGLVGVNYAMISPWAVSYPDGSAGDLLIAFYGGVGDTAEVGDTYAITANNGNAWSAEIAGSPFRFASAGRSVKLSVRLKAATTEGSGDSETVSSAGGTNLMAGIARLSAVNTASALEAIASGGSDGDTISLPTVDPLGDNRRTFYIIGRGDDAGAFATFTGGAGADQAVHSQAATTAGGDRRLGVASAAQTTETTVSGKSQTDASRTDSDGNLVVGFAVKPTGS